MKFALQQVFDLVDSDSNSINISGKIYGRDTLLKIIAENVSNLVGEIEVDDSSLEGCQLSEKQLMNYVPVSSADIKSTELQYLLASGLSGWISSQGSSVINFEEKFASLNNVNHCVSCANGTVAIQLALKALGIGRDDEVIVPALTFAATANAVAHCGAVPVFVDIDAADWNIDPEEVVKAISSKTRAIICVHLFGKPAALSALRDICDRHGLFLIEDCAEAHFATFTGRKVGGFGDISTFSFFSNKIISTGEGGCCLTSNPALDAKMRMLRDHGMNKSKKYWHDEIGFNFRMTAMQASVGLGQLSRREEVLGWRHGLRDAYDARFLSNNQLTFQAQEDHIESVCWLYSFLLPNAASREKAIELGAETAIDLRPFFNCLPIMPAFKPFDNGNKFPVAVDVAGRGVNLPTHRFIGEQEIGRIEKVVNKVLD